MVIEGGNLLIRGGQVVDPANGIDAVRDVLVRGGRIVAVGSDLAAPDGVRTLDASGLIVTPGLVDLHTHIYWGVTYWGIEPDPVAAATGVTTWLDVGSAGAYTFPGFREYIAARSRVRVYALLNLSAIGLVAPSWEFANPDYANVDLAASIVAEHPDLILGIKARIDANTTRGVGLRPLEQARELADRVGLPLMVHIGSGPPIREIAQHLRPGDILTHCFTGGESRIVEDNGTPVDEIVELQQQGLILDIGHGTGSFSFKTAENMMDNGIMPDVISSDIHQTARQGPMFDMPTTLSKFLNMGMLLPDVIERATTRAAHAMRRPELGTLSVGSQADIAVWKMEEGEFFFYDVAMNERPGYQQLVNVHTFIDGEELPRVPERPMHSWAKVQAQQRPIVGLQPGERIRRD